MQDYLFIKDGGRYVQISFSALHYVEAVQRYVRFVTSEKAYLTEGPLYEVESVLPADEFCRIHRSYIISLSHTRQFNATVVMVGDKQLPIGRHYRGILPSKVILP